MENELKLGIIAALENKPSANFSAEEVNDAAVNAIMAKCGLKKDSSPREIRLKEDLAFALIEEAVDEILPKKLEQVLGEFAEVRTFARDAEVVFNIEKIGKRRAKLTISKGARGGIYRAARLDSKYFSPATSVVTASVYVTLEEIILGTASLGELYNNILEGFEEIIYKDVFNALATGADAAGYGRIVDGATSGAADHNYDANRNILTTKATLGGALDMVMPIVKQYGVPTIFGSYRVLSALRNEAIGTNLISDVEDVRNAGFVQQYKGVRVVELPNYLIDNSNSEWFYNDSFVFVVPSGIKPVKVALKGELYLQRNQEATGGEKWEAHKMLGVGVAMANSYAVIKVTD